MRIADCGLRIADFPDLHFVKPQPRKKKGRKVSKPFGLSKFVAENLRLVRADCISLYTRLQFNLIQVILQSAIRNPQSLLLLLRGLRRLGVFEEFVDSILEDFDLALIFVAFASRFGVRLESQALTFAEESLSNALALLREFGQIGVGAFLGGEDQV